MGTTVYPVGNYNLDDKIIEVRTKNCRCYRISPLAATINENRECSALLKYEEYSEYGTFITGEQASYTGKVQLSKVPGYQYEVLVQFKGQKIHVPFFV